MTSFLLRYTVWVLATVAGILGVAWVLTSFGGWWGLAVIPPVLAGSWWLFWWNVTAE